MNEVTTVSILSRTSCFLAATLLLAAPLAAQQQLAIKGGRVIPINGDVIEEGGDIFGDGVNLATRLEALAEPGDVVVSGTIHDQVEGKVGVTFTDGGRHTVKNIARPVRV